MYYKLTSYIDDNGRVITEKEPQTKNIDIMLSGKFSGTVPLTARTPQGIIQMPFDFDFPDNMPIEECFDKFQEIAKEKIEAFKAEQQYKNRIVPATGIPKEITVK